MQLGQMLVVFPRDDKGCILGTKANSNSLLPRTALLELHNKVQQSVFKSSMGSFFLNLLLKQA